jgi:hypothetical protein
MSPFRDWPGFLGDKRELYIFTVWVARSEH